MSLKWGDLPEGDPIFSGTHFVFFAGPPLSTEELAAQLREEQGQSPASSESRVPGRRRRGLPREQG